MHHNLAWIRRLRVFNDASTYDTDISEPQGTGTIFPFTFTDLATGHSYMEFPYTLPQDYTLFILMKEQNIDIYKRKLDWILDRSARRHGPYHNPPRLHAF